MNVLPSCRLTAMPNVHVRRFDNEMVILHLDKGQYFGLDEVGAAMWDGFARGQTLLEVVKSLVEQYEVSEEQLITDAGALVTKLSEAGLATIQSAD